MAAYPVPNIVFKGFPVKVTIQESIKLFGYG